MTPIHFTPLYRVKPSSSIEGFTLRLQKKHWYGWQTMQRVEIVLCNVKMPGSYTKFRHFELWNAAEFSVKKRSEMMFIENVKG